MNMFKKLNTTEKAKFESWADDNYVPLTPISGTWHPVIQNRCAVINKNYDLSMVLADIAGGES